MDPIRPITTQIVLPDAGPGALAPKPPEADFRDIFRRSVSAVEGQRQSALATVDRFLSGEGEELHQVAIATQKAELSFDLFLQVRNKVVSAYQEVMRMQI